MNVLYVTHCTDMSGANQCLVQMILELRKNHGVVPFVVYPKQYDKNTKLLSDVLREKNIPNISHRLICFERSKVGILHKIYFLVFETLYLLHLLFLLRKHKFDLVHSNSSVIDIGQYLASCLHIPHIWHFREVAALSFGYQSVLGKRYQKMIYHKADRIISISQNVKEEFHDIVPLQKTVIIPDGILPDSFSPQINFNCDIINICIVGRVEPNKNQFEAVKAIELLPLHVRKTIRLHIVGNNIERYGQQLIDYIQEKGLENIVTVYGVRNDVNKMLQDMHVGLMLSKHEAFGRVTVEYMMHGLCVIASNTSANPEIIHDEDNGLLYEIGDPNDLANKIKILVEDRKLMQRLSQKGYNDAMNNYLSRTNSDKVFELYQSLNN